MISTLTKELNSVGKSFLSDEILSTFTHIIVSRWIHGAAATIVVYEWLITLDMEISLIWRNDTTREQKAFMKVFYLVNRYGVVADAILSTLHSYGTDVESCKTKLQVLGATTILGSFLSEYILALRVCVVWKMNKVVVFCLATAFISGTTFALTDFYLVLQPLKFFTILPFGGCLAHIQGSTVWIIYMVLLIYDTVMVALMAYPTIKEYKYSHGKTGPMRRIYDEGIIFYVFLVVVDVISLILQQAVRENPFIFPTPARLLRSILAARTILHIREVSSRGVHVYSDTEAVSGIRFHSMPRAEWDSQAEA